MNAFPLMDAPESNGRTQTACLTLAAGLHLALFVWNPVILANAWKTLVALGEETVVIVEVPGPQTSTLPGPAHIHSALPVQTPKAPGVLTPPRYPKPFHSMHLPPITPSHEPDLLIAPAPAAEVVKSPDLSPQIRTQAPPLLHSKTLIKSVFPFKDMSALPGENGTGRTQIHIIEPQDSGTGSAPSSSLVKSQKGPLIEGPLANRHVLHRVIPEYPSWAEEQGVVGTVKLYFTVNAGGYVRPTIRVEQTSGHPELDHLAIEALRRWQFSASATDTGAQWGFVTFLFALEQ